LLYLTEHNMRAVPMALQVLFKCAWHCTLNATAQALSTPTHHAPGALLEIRRMAADTGLLETLLILHPVEGLLVEVRIVDHASAHSAILLNHLVSRSLGKDVIVRVLGFMTIDGVR